MSQLRQKEVPLEVHNNKNPPGCDCVDLSSVTEPDASDTTTGVHQQQQKAGAGLEKAALQWTPRLSVQTLDTKSGGNVDTEETRNCIVLGGAELLATALLLFMGCAGAYIEKDKAAANVYGSAAFGFAVFMSTTIFGPVSGAHMNPLVTLLNLALGKIRALHAVVYIVSQTAGALLGYGLLNVVIPEDVLDAVAADTAQGAVCCTVPMEGMSSGAAILAEFVVTSILLSAVCASMSTPNAQPAFQFGVLIAGICTIEAIYTGASMNPSRSLAAAVWTGVWDRFWVYLVGQFASLISVAVLYSIFRNRHSQQQQD